MKYYRRFPGDYARDTAHLSMLEHGAYTLMLDTIYATERPLPAEADAIYRICRASTAAEKRAVRNVLEQFFPANEDGKRMNPRADVELKKGEKAIERMREGGKRGAEIREARKRGRNKGTHEGGDKGTHTEPINGGLRVEEHPPTSNTDTSLRSVSDPGSPLRYEPAADAAPDEVIWGAGLNLLSRSGVSEPSARSFLGGLRKRHEDGDIAAAIWRCMAEKPVEPRAWLKAALGDRTRRGVV